VDLLVTGAGQADSTEVADEQISDSLIKGRLSVVDVDHVARLLHC